MLEQLVEKGGVVREVHTHEEGGKAVLCLGGLEVTGVEEEIHEVFLDREKVSTAL